MLTMNNKSAHQLLLGCPSLEIKKLQSSPIIAILLTITLNNAHHKKCTCRAFDFKNVKQKASTSFLSSPFLS